MILNAADVRIAIRQIADRRIEQAIQEGKFSNLPGSGGEMKAGDPPPCEDERIKILRFMSRRHG